MTYTLSTRAFFPLFRDFIRILFSPFYNFKNFYKLHIYVVLYFFFLNRYYFVYI